MFEEVEDMYALYIAHATVEGVETYYYPSGGGIVLGKWVQAFQMSGKDFLYWFNLNGNTGITYHGIYLKACVGTPECQLFVAVIMDDLFG